jgi:hypothetical protein
MVNQGKYLMPPMQSQITSSTLAPKLTIDLL